MDRAPGRGEERPSQEETVGRPTRVIAVGNQKGGVGKTTNTVHIARALAELGRRCLVVDLDMNHGATNHLGIDGDVYRGTYEILLGSETPETVTLTNDPEEDVWLPENLDLIAARRVLENIDAALRERNKMLEPHRVLVDPIESVRGKYDYVFLDTAPNATIPTIAAYKTAEWFLLSAMPETFAIQGLNEAIQDINAARKHGNPKLKLLGVVLCNVDKRTRLARDLIAYVESSFAPKGGTSRKFKTMIPRSTVVSAAQKLGKTVFETDPQHKVTEQYRALAKELERKIDELTAARSGAPDEGDFHVPTSRKLTHA